MTKRERDTRLSLLCLIGAASLLAGCGGGGGGDASASTAPSQIVISGTVTFDKVPPYESIGPGGLDYANTVSSPARGVTVEAVSGSEVLASASTDAAGNYSLPLEANTENVLIRVRAEMLRGGTTGWNVRVVDNTEADALYVLEGTEFSIEDADLTHDLHAPSGWDGSAYSAPRSAAPFAILDVVYEATNFVLEVAPQAAFPPLVVHWSPNNVPQRDENDAANFDTGEIGTSLYFPGRGIFLLGAEDSDTEEYDRHVIAHEWGHYFEHAMSRSDSIGGPHTRGDLLDMRTAFSEGLGNALSAMVTGDTRYSDSSGPGQTGGFSFSVEGPFFPPHPISGASSPNPNPGWFSEESIQEIIYDLYDETQDIAADVFALGFAPIFEALTGQVRDTGAVTSIFPFITALKEVVPGREAEIDELLSTHEIMPITDHFGTGETENGGEPFNSDVLPIYKDISVGGSAENVCSTNDFASSSTGAVNKLGSRVFLRFAVATRGSHTLTATTTEMPAGTTADPDMFLHQRGRIARSESEPNEDACAVDQPPEGCSESFSRVLEPGEYVLEVFEWKNTQSKESDYPPIGRTCFDVSVTSP